MIIDQDWSVTAEGFPDQITWIGRILLPLKNVFTTILTALKGRLTIGDNVQGVTYTAKVTTDANYVATGSFTKFYIPWNFGNSPFSVSIGRVVVPSNQSPVRTVVACNDWTFNPGTNSSILINYIAGLADSSSYTINITIL